MSEKRGSLLSASVALLAFAALASFFGFQLLLSVVPLYAEASGGGSTGAGLATAVFMLSTVLTQVCMPRLMNRFGYRPLLPAGLLLLGAPCLLYLLAGNVAGILAVTLVRGVGFGIATVVFAALIVEIAPAGRRGAALGVLGAAITIPAIYGNALGLWLVERSGYDAVFLLGGAAPLVGFAATLGIRSGDSHGRGESGAGFFEGLGRPHLLRLFLLFSSATSATGVLVTFLPLAVPGAGLFSAATALLVFGVAGTASRFVAGHFGDRRDPHVLLAPGLIACAAGMAALPGGGPVMLGGALLLGAGVGALQNSTLLLTMERVAENERGLGSTLWNVSFDAGTGAGAFVFGFVVGASGYASAFYISSAILVAALALVALDRPSRS
jgi:predicted MFS family arabinose efflux permease